jgi:uncharacterized membrane protein YoaK (UPF0700 family)
VSADLSARLREAALLPHIAGLYLITAVCGLVDAACFLSFGKVFAEMMTGNLLLLAFDIGTGEAITDHTIYFVALAAFALGAVAGGRVVRSRVGHTRFGFAVEWCLLVLAAVATIALDPVGDQRIQVLVVAVLAFAMGMQNALLRRHGVPDLATNVMTLTMAALIAESWAAGGKNERWQRRAASIGIFAASALLGAVLTTQIGPAAPLLAAVVLFAIALTGLTRGSPAAVGN